MRNSHERDIHVIKYFSSVITVSEGKVINVVEPALRYCPLASHFFKEFLGTGAQDVQGLKKAVQKAIEAKIQKYGLFTKRRSFDIPDETVPYGASEMLAAALKKGLLDAAVVVCEGAGTLVAASPEVVEGIGARMNSVILTSPVSEIAQKLKKRGCRIVSEHNAWIDQVRGVEKAAELGYKKIGVTLCGSAANSLKELRQLEREKNITVFALAICTTGITDAKVSMLHDQADLVWSCASMAVREKIGASARLQLSQQIPVFVLTAKGVDFAAAYSDDPSLITGLDPAKQYLISHEPGGQAVRIGGLRAYVREAILPVYAQKTPVYQPGSKKEVLL